MATLKIIICISILFFVLLLVNNVSTQNEEPFWTEDQIDSWGIQSRKDRVNYLLEWLILGCQKGSDTALECNGKPRDYRHVEYEGYDGFYNNLGNPNWGAIDTPLLRKLPPAYSDGSYEPVIREANPLDVSKSLMKGENGEISKVGNTAFLLFFGQQVVEEVLDAQGAACPPEYFNLEIPEDHKYRTSEPHLKILPFLRTRYNMNTGYSPNNPRQQLNEITPYIDGGLIYGSGKGWADVLRLDHNNQIAKDGKLAEHSVLGWGFPGENTEHRLPMANPPPPTNHSQYTSRGFTADVGRFLKLGNPRGSENPFLLTFGIFWYRWHNVIAEFLKEKYPDWDGERIFNEARKWVIATQQSVTVYDWLHTYIKSPMDKYESYQPTVDPQVSHIFQSAAMRFGHTMVPSGVYLRDTADDGCGTTPYKLDHNSDAKSDGVRTCNSFWRSPELFKGNNLKKNFDRFLMGMSSQATEKEDNIIVEDLRGNVFGPLEFSRRDLMAVNIQRGRDHGLPDYNTARMHFGLKKLASLEPNVFKETTNTLVPDDVLQKLKEVYNGNVDNVDIWAGGLLETTDSPGQLFTAVIKDQFQRIRNGDRFWYENKKNGLFTEDEIGRIGQMKIIHLLLAVSEISLDDIQPNPFVAPSDQNLPKGDSCNSSLSKVVTNCKVYNSANNSYDRTTCRYLPPLGRNNLEPCSKPMTYDYFKGSIASYILSFIAIGVITIALISGVRVSQFIIEKKKREKNLDKNPPDGNLICKERIKRLSSRIVIISFNGETNKIIVKDMSKQVLRFLDITHIDEINVFNTENYKYILIQIKNHYDLYLICDMEFYASNFLKNLKNFCEERGKTYNQELSSFVAMTKHQVTASDRNKKITKFMDAVLDKKDGNQLNTLKSIQLTKYELAEAMGLTPDSLFLTQLFHIMDLDQNGFLTLQEFASVMIKFSKGTLDEKAQILFRVYDIDQSGYISFDEFNKMLESMIGSEAKQEQMQSIITSLIELAVIDDNKQMDFARFKELLFSDETVSNCIQFDLTRQDTLRKSRFSMYISHDDDTCSIASDIDVEELSDDVNKEVEDKGSFNAELVNFFKSKELIIFWRTLYTLVLLLIFAERAYYYSVEREHAGLRRIAGYGVTITRGAASAMMFTYSSLLVTMCRNIFSVLRSSFVSHYYPFDDMVEMHKYIGWWAFFFTVVHVVGHSINFYHISTQTASDLSCLFRNFYRQTHILPKFHYWCWSTVTGITGVILTIQVVLIYVFAVTARRKYFRWFWLTHNTYPFFYFLTILHGSGSLVQEPIFHLFFLGPCVLFVIDKIISVSRKSVEKRVLKAEHLASDVVVLHIERPLNFSYLSGQWVRIASLAISTKEFHPFTLSSAPHEKHLTLHIRGVGPWTRKLKKKYADYESLTDKANYEYPMIYLDGPFGEGHQNWYDFEVVVLVGGGIGVTPFASILKDIVYKCNQPSQNFKCKKVIFLWVTRTQKKFEWMTNILRSVEEGARKDLIRIHIFITQFKSKYDLRTLMLYHAERRFQKVSGCSMFTGLKAITHFSRPNFEAVFKTIKQRYTEVPTIGVFTCGNASLSSSVDTGCQTANKMKGPIMKHYYENF